MTRSRRIVFVCSGNICRSPMAEYLAKAKLADAGIPAVAISAGTLGILGQPAAFHAVRALEEWGYDLSPHRSQGITVPLLRMADHIAVMAPRHEYEIIQREPALRPRIVRLWDFTEKPGAERGVPDPVGQDLASFIEIRDVISDCLDNWIATMQPIA